LDITVLKKKRLFQNRLLRRTSGPWRHEVTGGWGMLLNEELHSLCSSPSIIRMIKARVKWTRHVARMERQMHVGYGMLRRVALVKTDVSEELSAWVIRVTWYFFAACVGC
jgi:hypothetical protein